MVNKASSEVVGTAPKLQLVVVFKIPSVPVNVSVAAPAFGATSNMMAIRIVTMKKMAKARLETMGSGRRFAVWFADGSKAKIVERAHDA